MPVFPIPVFASLVLAFLFAQIWMRERRIGPLALLLGLCAVQALIIALAQHYKIPGMRLVMPITATLIPPLAWIALQTTAIRNLRTSDWVNLAGPFCALAAILVAPAFLDVLIPALFIGYGAAILIWSLSGADALPRIRLETGDLPARLWLFIGATLIVSAFSDILILAVQIAGYAYLQPWIVSFYSVANLLLIGMLSLSGDLSTTPDEEVPAAPETTVEDTEIMERLSSYMAERKPYLDPDLTLIKLARKLVVPAKTLSAAINRSTGENVSRYINKARIAEAQSALLKGEPVTSAMLSAGFNTKSNFNREFLRVTGTSPSEWLKQHT